MNRENIVELMCLAYAKTAEEWTRWPIEVHEHYIKAMRRVLDAIEPLVLEMHKTECEFRQDAARREGWEEGVRLAMAESMGERTKELIAKGPQPKCPNCGPLGNDFCTWEGHSK